MNHNQINDEMLNSLVKRIEGESPLAYDAFCQYARLNPKERMIEKSAQSLSEMTGAKVETVKFWCKQLRWAERASMIDAYLLKLDILERQKQNSELNLAFIETNRKLKTNMMSVLTDTMGVLQNIVTKAKDDDEVKFKLTDIGSIVKAMREGVSLVNDIPTEIVGTRTVADKDIGKIEDLSELEQMEREVNKEMETIQNNTVQ